MADRVILWTVWRDAKCESMILRDTKNPTSFEKCDRPAKGSINGKPACGIHLAAANKQRGDIGDAGK